jgi:hypothetical protein
VPLVVFSQTKDYIYYYQQIDSLKKMYSKERMPTYNENILSYNFFKYYGNLPVEEKRQLIHKIKNFYDVHNPLMLYYIAESLLLHMHHISDELEIKQDIMSILIDKTFYTGNKCNCWQGDAGSYSLDSTKMRLKEIMQGKIKEKELDIFKRKYEIAYKLNAKTYYEKEARKIMKETKRTDEKIFDFTTDRLKK